MSFLKKLLRAHPHGLLVVFLVILLSKYVSVVKNIPESCSSNLSINVLILNSRIGPSFLLNTFWKQVFPIPEKLSVPNHIYRSEWLIENILKVQPEKLCRRVKMNREWKEKIYKHYKLRVLRPLNAVKSTFLWKKNKTIFNRSVF